MTVWVYLLGGVGQGHEGKYSVFLPLTGRAGCPEGRAGLGLIQTVSAAAQARPSEGPAVPRGVCQARLRAGVGVGCWRVWPRKVFL